MNGFLGIALVVVGGAHTSLSLGLRRATLGEMAREGLFGSVSRERTDRMALFWSVAAGLAWILLGGLFFWVERGAGVEIPRLFVLGLLAYSIAGAALMPRGGFWLLILPLLVALVL